MTHYELRKYAEELGLMVETISYANHQFRRSETLIVFREQPTNSIFGLHRGDKIAHLVIHTHMNAGEYADACAIAQNSLRQYSTWRKY